MSKKPTGKMVDCPAYRPDERSGRGGERGEMDKVVKKKIGLTGPLMRDVTDLIFFTHGHPMLSAWGLNGVANDGLQ